MGMDSYRNNADTAINIGIAFLGFLVGLIVALAILGKALLPPKGEQGVAGADAYGHADHEAPDAVAPALFSG